MTNEFLRWIVISGQMNLFSNIRLELGQIGVRTVRNWEDSEIKLAKYRNHLKFNLRCKQEDVFPASLNIACPIKTAKGQEIIHRAKQALLRERINIVSNKIHTLQSNVQFCESEARETLPQRYLGQVVTLVEKSREQSYQETKCRQIEKLSKLKERRRIYNDKNIDLSAPWLKKWVVNLSKSS